MKFFVVLVSLFAAVQAEIFLSAPGNHSIIRAGRNMTVEIIVPIDTSAEAGQVEVSLVLGLVECSSTSSCPAPSANLGVILFIGKCKSQGVIGKTLQSFENFTFTVPANLSGPASFQIQHTYLLTPPGQAIPAIEYTALAVEVLSSDNHTVNTRGYL